MLQKEIMILCIVICHIPMKFIPSGGKCHRCRQEENQDSIGKALKDIALMRFSMAANSFRPYHREKPRRTYYQPMSQSLTNR